MQKNNGYSILLQSFHKQFPCIFMENEVNGIHVDAAIIDRFAGLDRAAGEELGIEISVQAAKAALPYADGFYLMTPFNRVALMERLIARLKEEVIKD